MLSARIRVVIIKARNCVAVSCFFYCPTASGRRRIRLLREVLAWRGLSVCHIRAFC